MRIVKIEIMYVYNNVVGKLRFYVNYYNIYAKF